MQFLKYLKNFGTWLNALKGWRSIVGVSVMPILMFAVSIYEDHGVAISLLLAITASAVLLVIIFIAISLYDRFFSSNINATEDQKIKLKQDLVALKDTALGYGNLDDKDIDKLKNFKSCIGYSNDKKVEQMFRDIDNSLMNVFHLKKEGTREGSDDMNKAKERVKTETEKLLKKL